MDDWKKRIIDDRSEIKKILEINHVIAVVGMKNRPGEAAYDVPMIMKESGYQIIPVNPKYKEIEGMKSYPYVNEVSEPVDIVNVWRASENIPPVVDKVLQMKPLPKVFWMQVGIEHAESAERLAKAGIQVIQNRCISVEHRLLVHQ